MSKVLGMAEKYANGKVYKLCTSTDDEFYIGSTCIPLDTRLHNHKQCSKKYHTRKVYQHFNSVGWDKVSIVLVESFPCECRAELEKRERFYVEQMKPTLNSRCPATPHKEAKEAYRKRNPEKIKEQYAKWKANNQKYRAEYELKNPDYVERERERKAKYKEENREAINARARERYAKKKALSTAENYDA